jgi:hypothetical protein
MTMRRVRNPRDGHEARLLLVSGTYSGTCSGSSGNLGRDEDEGYLFLPVTDNDGRDLTAEIQAVEDECFVAFGAWTLTGYFKGSSRKGVLVP